MSRQGTAGRDELGDAELDWDAVLREPEQPQRPEPTPPPAAPVTLPAPGAPAPPVAAVPARDPDRPAVVSLGAGWSVVPGPGRWGGTLRISEAARARALAERAEARPAGDDPAVEEWEPAERSASAHRRPALRLADGPGDRTTGRGPAENGADDQPLDDRSHDARAYDARPHGARATDDQPLDEQPLDDRAAAGRAQRDVVQRALRRAVEARAGGRAAHRPAVDKEPRGRPSSEDLTPDLLVRDRRSGPRTGLRGALYRASGRTVNLGPSAAELRQRELLDQVRTPIGDCFRVAVVSLKGGVGKTTATFCLGATLASLRGDRVIAIDANPDVGTLAEHVVRQTRSNVWDLLAEPGTIGSYAQVRAFTSQSPDRLEVLASARDPQLSHAFDATDYEQVMRLAERFYTMVVTDCGTGMVHSAMTGVLASVDQLVLVSSASLDGARSASATLDWLEAQGHGALAAEACVVVNSVRSRSAEVDVDRLAEHFLSRSRSVVTVPYDPHLAQGTSIELGSLQRATRQAWVELAGAVVSDRG